MAIFQKLSKDDMEKIMQTETPSEKAKKKITFMTVFRCFEILIALAYVVVLAFGRFIFPADSAFYQSFDLFSKENPMIWIRHGSTVLAIIIAGTLLRIIIKLLSKNKTITKKTSVAVLQLLSNLVKYVIVIVIICVALDAFGVDTAAIIGGLGIFALIIGLGVTSLIEDIVAGIFIISERTFDIGDIIVVDGFRGTVVSIGVRSTKIADIGGDIRTMRNSSIGAVVNLTDRQSCAAITIPIAPGESLVQVEEIIRSTDLSEISKSCDKMIGNPIYLGLCEITAKGVQMLLFIAGCMEENRYDVERALYHGLKVMFESNGIKLGNPILPEEENA